MLNETDRNFLIAVASLDAGLPASAVSSTARSALHAEVKAVHEYAGNPATPENPKKQALPLLPAGPGSGKARESTLPSSSLSPLSAGNKSRSKYRLRKSGKLKRSRNAGARVKSVA